MVVFKQFVGILIHFVGNWSLVEITNDLVDSFHLGVCGWVKWYQFVIINISLYRAHIKLSIIKAIKVIL